jgi:threonyl-tRNA synthetase
MAAAITKLYPGAKFGVGPTTENGFYYDVLVDSPLKEADLPRIESEMRTLAKHHIPFARIELPIDQALDYMKQHSQPFKVELLELLRDRGTTAVVKETGDDDAIGVIKVAGVEKVSFYTLGDFVDLCRGPHVTDSGAIGEFKLTSLAGAYWRGNSENPQLQRIYGMCFRTSDEVEKELWQIEQRKLRDHRILGRQLEIYAFADEIGSGLPLWLPKGTILRMELEKLAHEREKFYGYQRVITPSITKAELYYQSGHLPYYKGEMYPPMALEDGGDYYLRPMNCPHHHHIFLSKPRTYRDMPLRLAEYGDVYRYEPHGALSGLMRTRCFCQNDAHIYCRFDQAKDEFLNVMRMHAEYYDLFGIEQYYMRLSLPDMDRLDKYVDDPEKWSEALRIIRLAMKESGYPFVEAEGEAAFYGPKIDFMIRSAVGTEYAISTNQLDFLATSRFNLTYKGNDDQHYPVYVIHRSPLGSHERFIAFLIEHFAGAFPTWLAPVQAVVVPISDRHFEYARKVQQLLESADIRTATDGLRIEVDTSAERMQKKIRSAQLMKIPYQFVVGDREQQEGTAAVRLRKGADLGPMPIDAIIKRLAEEVRSRRDVSRS